MMWGRDARLTLYCREGVGSSSHERARHISRPNRGSGDELSGKKALHVVNVWFSGTGMVLGQVKTSEKSNEITVIPELLDLIYYRDVQ